MTLLPSDSGVYAMESKLSPTECTLVTCYELPVPKSTISALTYIGYTSVETSLQIKSFKNTINGIDSQLLI